jgi:RNA polymerase sigma-70 factor, ECF subfamily
VRFAAHVRYNQPAVKEEGPARHRAANTDDPGHPSAALIEACGRGDRAAFGRLFEASKDRVYSLALRLTGNPSEAADLTQEVFLKLLTRLSQFRSDARFSTWLHRIVVNAFLDRRRSARRLVALADATPAGAGSGERDAQRRETARLLAQGVAGLEPTLRVPVVLRFVAGLSYEEIAEVLEMPLGTVASRLSRALRTLAASLPDPRHLEI